MNNSDNSATGIAVYVLIAFGLAWLMWEIPLRNGLSPRTPLFQLAILPGTFAPAVAAFVVRKWVTREGFADAGLRLNVRQWRYYLIAWCLPLGVTTVILALAVGFELSQPDFSLQRALGVLAPPGNPPSALPSNPWLFLPFQLLLSAVVVTPIAWGEEFGWRGYLQLRLFGQPPLLAAVSTGVIWGVWHAPLNVRGYNYPDHPFLGLVVFPVSTIFLSIIFGWLRQQTGSVWAASLAHAATNAIGGSLTMLLFMGGPNWICVSYAGLLGWIPLGAVCAWIVFSGQLKSGLSHETIT